LKLNLKLQPKEEGAAQQEDYRIDSIPPTIKETHPPINFPIIEEPTLYPPKATLLRIDFKDLLEEHLLHQKPHLTTLLPEHLLMMQLKIKCLRPITTTLKNNLLPHKAPPILELYLINRLLLHLPEFL
jgi:hypothetical protein